MENGQMSEAQFLNLVSLIAAKHNCKIKEIDFNLRVINLEGPGDAELACALELEDVFLAADQRHDEPMRACG